MTFRRVAFASALVGALVVALALANAPVLWAWANLTGGHEVFVPAPPQIRPTPPGPMEGQVVKGHWRVQRIDADTYAIGEPQDDPDNYEYLLIGARRALLIDAGAAGRDIHEALAGLTDRPITVIPTHLHFDHTNGLKFFDHIALVDLPQTRARLRDGVVRPGRLEYMAPLSQPTPAFRVAEWIRPDSDIDLGGRTVRLLWTPGHTASSVSIYDPARKRLFTGDMIYTTTIFAFMPDSSLSAYLQTADRLLATLPADTRIYGAHCCRNDRPATAPWLEMGDLRDLRTAVAAVRDGHAQGRGFLLKRYPVNARMTLATLYPFGNH